MKTISKTQKNWVEMQGFVGYPEHIVAEFGPWLRLSPAICMVWIITGTYLQSYSVTLALVPFAILGAVLPMHPFDTIYNFGLRYLFHTAPIPRYPAPRRFACVMATCWLLLTAGLFYFEMNFSGLISGYALAAAAFSASVPGFCIPSFLFGLVMGKPSAS